MGFLLSAKQCLTQSSVSINVHCGMLHKGLRIETCVVLYRRIRRTYARTSVRFAMAVMSQLQIGFHATSATSGCTSPATADPTWAASRTMQRAMEPPTSAPIAPMPSDCALDLAPSCIRAAYFIYKGAVLAARRDQRQRVQSQPLMLF